jgi:hypothetical protein
MSSTTDPAVPRPDADPAWHAELQDPRAAVPSGTSVRFAALVLVVTASTGSIFGYLWQLSRPDLEARAHRCLASFSSGPLAKLIARLASASVTKAAASADCVRPDGPALTAWSLTGIGILLALTLVIYLVTPWWMVRVGWPGRGRLRKLDSGLATYVEHLATEIGVPRPVCYVDWGGQDLAEARVFGYRRRPYIRLPAGLLVEFEAQATRATEAARDAGRDAGPPARPGGEPVDVLLHELAHLANRDNLPTYLTRAALQAFAFLIPAAYLVMLAISGVRPANPGPRIIVSAGVLAAAVVLSARAVIRSRELHADATAAHLRRLLKLGPGNEPDPPPAEPARTLVLGLLSRLAAAWRQARRYHPSAEERAAVLSEPERLYRPDPLAMASAGVAITVMASEVTPALFSALLSPLLRPGSPLLDASGTHPLLLILLTYGPAALLTAFLVVALASAMGRRREYLAVRGAAGAPASGIACLALSMAAGMLAGIPLSFDYVLAGTWGVFDTSGARNLIVAGMSAVVLVVTLLVVFGWASECAAVWFVPAAGRPRLAQAAMLVTGALGLAPALLAWAITSGLPLSFQLLPGVDVGQKPYIGRWPAATLVSTHLTALGAFDIVPGGAVLLALPCVFVAVRSLRPPALPPGSEHGARVPVATVLTTGLTAAGISVAAGLVLMLSLHAVIGAAQITRAGGYGLLYLNRFVQVVIAVCAGFGAVLAARRAGRAGLTSGILTALVTATAAAVFVPKLLFLGELRWGYRHVNPTAYPTLYGIAGNMTPGKAVAAALLLMAVSGAVSRLAARYRHRAAGAASRTAGSGPAHARVRTVSRLPATVMLRLATGLGFAALLTALTLAGYYYFHSYTYS